MAIRTGDAAGMPGVARVFTFADLERWLKPLPVFGAAPPGLAAVVRFEVRQATQYALAKDRARHVGEIVAMVVADGRARAEDAVDRIEVEWEPLPPAADMIAAAAPDAPLVHPEWGTNVGVAFTHGIGDVDGAFAAADVVMSETFRIQRYVGMPLERGVVRRDEASIASLESPPAAETRAGGETVVAVVAPLEQSTGEPGVMPTEAGPGVPAAEPETEVSAHVGTMS